MPQLATVKSGDIISGIYRVVDVEKRHFSSKPGRYIRLRIADSSGILTAICFDPDLIPFTIQQDMQVAIQHAKAKDFANELRLYFLPGSISKISDMD